MNSISKNVYITKLDDIENKCNNTYYRTIKIKPPVDLKLAYIYIYIYIVKSIYSKVNIYIY